MFGRVGKWMVLALVGVLAIGAVGVGAVYAQGPNPGPRTAGPSRTPQAACPLGSQGGGMAWHWGASMPQMWADALGIKLDELTAAVQSGKTIADLVKEKGLTTEALVDKAITARKAVLQQAVDAKRLTQAQADAMLEQMRTQMTQRIEGGACTPGAGQGRGRMGANGQQMGRQGGLNCPLRQAAPQS